MFTKDLSRRGGGGDSLIVCTEGSVIFTLTGLNYSIHYLSL